MEVFLDKDFIMNFWNVSSTDKTIIDNFKETFLKKAKNFCLKTNFSSLDEIKDNEEYLVIMEMLFESIPEMEFSVHPQKTDWLNNELNTIGGYKLFLIEIEQKECEAYTKETGFEFICTNNLSSCWKKYLSKEIEKSLLNLGQKNDPDVLNSWKDLSFIGQSPTKSIIVVDRYIFSDSWSQRINENLYPLLEAIIPFGICSSLDILIIAENISSELHQQINEHFTKFQEKIKINFYFLTWAYTFMDTQTIHDRYIYTNYYTIYSGPGFNIFNYSVLKESNGLFFVKFSFAGLNMKICPFHLLLLKNYASECTKQKERTKIVNNVKIKLLNYYPDYFYCPLLS